MGRETENPVMDFLPGMKEDDFNLKSTKIKSNVCVVWKSELPSSACLSSRTEPRPARGLWAPPPAPRELCPVGHGDGTQEGDPGVLANVFP